MREKSGRLQSLIMTEGDQRKANYTSGWLNKKVSFGQGREDNERKPLFGASTVPVDSYTTLIKCHRQNSSPGCVLFGEKVVCCILGTSSSTYTESAPKNTIFSGWMDG